MGKNKNSFESYSEEFLFLASLVLLDAMDFLNLVFMCKYQTKETDSRILNQEY